MSRTTQLWIHGLSAATVTGLTTAATTWLLAPQLDKVTLFKIVVAPTVIAALAYLSKSPVPPLPDAD